MTSVIPMCCTRAGVNQTVVWCWSVSTPEEQSHIICIVVFLILAVSHKTIISLQPRGPVPQPQQAWGSPIQQQPQQQQQVFSQSIQMQFPQQNQTNFFQHPGELVVLYWLYQINTDSIQLQAVPDKTVDVFSRLYTCCSTLIRNVNLCIFLDFYLVLFVAHILN